MCLSSPEMMSLAVHGPKILAWRIHTNHTHSRNHGLPVFCLNIDTCTTYKYARCQQAVFLLEFSTQVVRVFAQ